MGVEQEERAGLKPPAQYVEILRINERVEFIRLPRTEAGLKPAPKPALEDVLGLEA